VFLVKRTAARLSSVARSARLDRAQICRVGTPNPWNFGSAPVKIPNVRWDVEGPWASAMSRTATASSNYYPDSTAGLHGPIHIRPVTGQEFPTYLHVECSKDLVNPKIHPVGTLLPAPGEADRSGRAVANSSIPTSAGRSKLSRGKIRASERAPLRAPFPGRRPA